MPEVLTEEYGQDLLRLYDAACRAKQLFVQGRSFDEWRDKVSDAGLAAARYALEAEIDAERARLEREVIEKAKEWPANYEREELLTDSLGLALFDATQVLIDFESQIKK